MFKCCFLSFVFMGIDLIYLKFKNVVSIPEKEICEGRIHLSIFPPFFSVSPFFFLLGRAPPSAVLALGCILAKMEAN